MKKHSGIFITLEGTEGSGKSTLIPLVAKRIKKQAGIRVTITREPGGSPVAEAIREVILRQKMDPKTELFLYEAARAEHLARTVRPALARGHWVLCDRYTDSSLAYQGMARGLDWNEIRDLNDLATSGLKPDLTILLDQDPAKTLRHATVKNRFEREGLAFHRRVRAGYLKARRQEPSRWLLIPARSQAPEDMADDVAKLLLERFKKQAERGRSAR